MRYTKGFFTVVPNISKLSGKNPVLQCIYMRLCKYSNEDGESYPSQKRLCENCGIAKNTLKKYLEELIDLGLLIRTRRFNNNEETTSLYQVLIGESNDNTCVSKNDGGGSNYDIGGSTDAYRTISIKLNHGTNILSKDNTTKVVEYGNNEINNLIEHLKDSCSKNGLIYSGKGQKERKACTRLLSKKFSDSISQFGMDLYTFVNNIIFVSSKLQYTSKQATSAYDIYYNWEHFVNLAQKKKSVGVQKQERHATFEGMEWAW